jgi:hypothetical protein
MSMINKINQKLYMLINNNKFVDSNQILNQEIKIKILLF